MRYQDCKTEQAFKMEWIRQNRGNFLKLFCIETEETVKGFPDVLAISTDDVLGTDLVMQTPKFYEFKIARKGKIHFQATQPAFYKANKILYIDVVALVEHKEKHYIVQFPVSCLFEKDGIFALSDRNEVDLRKYCEEAGEAL